ncbi:MAG: hypothetical protein V4857_02990 [Pseudomonadota bacterium]
MLKVFITVDTEVWPNTPGWPRTPIAAARTDFRRESALYLDGATGAGEFGVGYQLAMLARYGLKACFFVEPLAAARIGTAALEKVVGQVQRAGHEVQLHLHTEWLGDLHDATLPPRYRQFMHEFSMPEQAALIRAGAALLEQAGAAPVCAFRAGSFGANADTLRALAACGLAYDSSYNPTCLHPDFARTPVLEQPARIGGVWEFPVSSYADYPRHRRHAQLCACSFAEMRAALMAAWQARWYSFVIVLHSFELLRGRSPPHTPAPDWRVVGRFESLCRLLDAERDKFSTTLFRELDPAQVPALPHAPALRGTLRRTLLRAAQQRWPQRNS